MTVARDAVLESATFTTTSPHTFTFTPVGTPRAILLAVAHGTVSTDLITGAVTYGGVAMTRIATNGFAQATTGEVGATYLYFLGASIPTGAQTVSITHTGSADVKWAICQSMTAAANTEIGVSAKLEGSQTNPQSALSTTPSSLRSCIIYSGTNAPGNLVVLSGMEANAAANSHDFGNFSAGFGQQTTAASGSFTIGYTVGVQDSAFIAAAVQESAGTQALTGTLFTKAPTFFTGVVTSVRNLAGALFTKAPTFFTGTVTATRNLAGSLFTKAPTFFTGTVTSVRALTGVLFTKAPTFPTGAVSLASSPQTVNGVLFTKAPTFPTGAVTSTYALTGSLFVKAPTFFAGTVTTGGVTLTGTLFVKAPTFFTGTITAGTVSLTGVLFQQAPTFPTGTVTTTVTLTGTLFQKAPTFPTGTIGQAGTLFGNLFVKAPTFFVGTVTQGAPSFWITNPAGYTPNPVAFVRIGGAGPSPWGTQLSGRRFEKAPTFPVGTVT